MIHRSRQKINFFLIFTYFGEKYLKEFEKNTSEIERLNFQSSHKAELENALR